MNIAPANPTSLSDPTLTTGAGARGDSIAGFDDFLQLLTTQLEQQDPLTPVDSDQFTRQIVDFASVEQASRINDRLATLIDTVAAGQLLTAAAYVGREVEFSGDELFFDGTGPAELVYSLPRDAAEAELVIRGPDGAEIARRAVPATAGTHRAVWDGRDAKGLSVASGVYRVEIVAADEAGTAVAADLRTVGTVDAVHFEDDTLLLSVGGLRRPATSITAVRQTGPR